MSQSSSGSDSFFLKAYTVLWNNSMRWAQIALRYKLRSIHLTKAEIVRALIIFLNCIAIAKG